MSPTAEDHSPSPARQLYHALLQLGALCRGISLSFQDLARQQQSVLEARKAFMEEHRRAAGERCEQRIRQGMDPQDARHAAILELQELCDSVAPAPASPPQIPEQLQLGLIAARTRIHAANEAMRAGATTAVPTDLSPVLAEVDELLDELEATLVSPDAALMELSATRIGGHGAWLRAQAEELVALLPGNPEHDLDPSPTPRPPSA